MIIEFKYDELSRVLTAKLPRDGQLRDQWIRMRSYSDLLDFTTLLRDYLDEHYSLVSGPQRDKDILNMIQGNLDNLRR